MSTCHPFSKSVGLISLIGLIGLILPTKVSAANLYRAYIRTDRMIASTATGGTVCVRMNTAGSTDANVEVTFPADYTVNGTAGNWTVTTTNLPTGTSAMPGVATATNVTGQTVRFPITDIANNTTTYCFNFSGTTTLTTGAAGNDKQATITVRDAGLATIDSANVALAVIANDLVTITGTVPPTFSFALGTNTQSLGILSTSSVTSGSGVSVTLGTNASNGWIAWVKSQNAALNSGSTSDTIPTSGSIDNSPSTLSNGTKGYVLDCDLTTDSGTAGTGTVTVAAEYNGTSTSMGGTLSTTFQEVATANGPTDSDVVTLVPRVTISALTEAATDYTDILTVVGAAVF